MLLEQSEPFTVMESTLLVEAPLELLLDVVLLVPDVVLVPPPEPQPDKSVMTRSAMDILLDFIIGHPGRD